MDESSFTSFTPLVSPLALPAHTSRPGGAVRVQGIDTIQAVSKPNDYVDPYTISSIANNAPTSVKSEPKLKQKYREQKSSNRSSNRSSEQSDNLCNERRERVHCKHQRHDASEKPPVLPPRAAPPLPPRIRRHSCSRAETLPRHVVTSTALPSCTTQTVRRSRSLTRQHSSSVTNRSCVVPPLRTSSTRCLPQHSSRGPQPAILISTESSRTMLLGFNANKSKHIVSQPTRSSHGQRAEPMIVSTDQAGNNITNSVFCPECGQCRCRSCKGRCSCNVERAVDILSCMCCVRSCVNNCTDNHEDNYAPADPCSCTGNQSQCCLRWTTLSTLTLCIPCLLLYWPLKLLGRPCHSRGCNCDRHP